MHIHFAHGGVAQLVEHLPCKQGVRSSTLLISTNLFKRWRKLQHLEKYIAILNKLDRKEAKIKGYKIV